MCDQCRVTGEYGFCGNVIFRTVLGWIVLEILTDDRRGLRSRAYIPTRLKGYAAVGRRAEAIRAFRARWSCMEKKLC